MRKLGQEDGFTLLELVVVIVSVVILATLFMIYRP